MMMSMLFEGRFYAVSPYTAYDDSQIAVIRPLIYVSEGEIKNFAQQYQLPLLKTFVRAMVILQEVIWSHL